MRKDKSLKDNSWKTALQQLTALYVKLMNTTLKDQSFDNDIATPLMAQLNDLEVDLALMTHKENMERTIAEFDRAFNSTIAHAPAKS